ncbi:MAG: LON peptidase substrate-binding domain-containing protein [Gemmataceae bacterium]|nr:LON peptidase substrate-binding domain-containing protein [Gemmataceae bacterium]
MFEELISFDDIPRLVRVFPLPNLVFFPSAVQPLHIFEPRYREMTADALASDRLIALVMLKGDWENDYHKRPQVEEYACLGQIIGDQKLPDGRYNLLLRGVARIHLDEELILPGKSYRTFAITPIADELGGTIEQLMENRRQLNQLFIPRLGEESIRQQVQNLFDSETPLGDLCDILTFATSIPLKFKQKLLETFSVYQRSQMLIDYLQQKLSQAPPPPQPERRPYPPKFSDN